MHVAKMYGVIYKFKFAGIKQTESKIELKTEAINESIEIHLKNDKTINQIA